MAFQPVFIAVDSAASSQALNEQRQEISRLEEKLALTDDRDIANALRIRIAELESSLKSHAQSTIADALLPEEAKPQLTKEAESSYRQELARTSTALYSREDPEERAKLQARIKELQTILSIDVNKLAGREMRDTAIPDLTVAAKPKKSVPKAKVDMAELQALVAEKSAQIRKTENRIEISLPENPEPPTPEELDKAEKLIQQARVEKMRGNKPEVQRLLEEAVRVAPGSPSVLELVGDDFAERKQTGRALAYYRRAAKIDPKNVNLERKVAMAALGMDASGAIDPKMKASLSSSLDESAIPMASRRAAMLLSLFLPGIGHIVLGLKSKGWTILGIWCLCLAWAILMGGDIAKLGAAMSGGKSQPNYLVLVPILIMLATYIATLADFKSPKESERKHVDRPRPPIDLPFE